MDTLDPDIIFSRICDHAGQVFYTIRHQGFTYAAGHAHIHLDRNRNVTKKDIEKALRMLPVSGPSQLKSLQGPSYIYGLLSDERISRSHSLQADNSGGPT